MLNGKEVELDVPVTLFANKLTKKKTPNPSYASIERVKNEFCSIAAVGIEKADRVRVGGAQITMNEYYNQNGILNSYPRVSASFITKITDLAKYHPEASFSAIFAIGSMGYDTDSEGVEIPDRYKIRGILPRYNGEVDVVDFYATSPTVIDAVSSYWQTGDTIKVNGKLNFTMKTEEVVTQVDFGEPQVTRTTRSVSELIITGGSSTPLEGDFAFNTDEIQEALNNRQARLAALKERATQRGNRNTGTTKAPKRGSLDLGF